MFIVIRFYFIVIILNILENNNALVELPRVEDNDILHTESIIRNATNKLFYIIKLKGARENPKLKQYGLIHNYFVSLTLKDYNNLKEIARLTRVDKKAIGNKSINFIDLINEILNGDIDGEGTILSNFYVDNKIGNYIDEHSNNVAYLKQIYGDNSPRTEINKEIIKILENDHRYLNKTVPREHNNEEDSNILLDENDFWVPETKNYRRIYQGKRTKIKYFPFMASVQFFNKFQCGGSIISNDLVITAASCLQLVWNNKLFRENPSFLSVRIGSNYYEGGGEMVAVLEVYFYPSYNPKNLWHNLAILRLVRKINFKGKKITSVKKIDFDRKDNPLPINTDSITIVGWGSTRHSGVVVNPWENKISFAVLDVYPIKDCQDAYSKEYVTLRNFCAGSLSQGSGACNKDVGGPGIVNGILTGVISFGSPICGTPDSPTVFTKVGYYADWIEEIIQQDELIPHLRKISTTTTEPRITYPTDVTSTKKMLIIRENVESNETTGLRQTSEEELKKVTRKLPSGPAIDKSPAHLYHKEKSTTENSSILFKQFLKTMFSSTEIDQYLDVGDTNDSRIHKDEIVEELAKQQKITKKDDKIMNNTENYTASKEVDYDTFIESYKGSTQLIPFEQSDVSEEITETPTKTKRHKIVTPHKETPSETPTKELREITVTSQTKSPTTSLSDIIITIQTESPIKTEKEMLVTSQEKVTGLDKSIVFTAENIDMKSNKRNKITSKKVKVIEYSSENDYSKDIFLSKEDKSVNTIREDFKSDKEDNEDGIIRLIDVMDREEKNNWQKDHTDDVSDFKEYEALKDNKNSLISMVDNADLQKKISTIWHIDTYDKETTIYTTKTRKKTIKKKNKLEGKRLRKKVKKVNKHKTTPSKKRKIKKAMKNLTKSVNVESVDEIMLPRSEGNIKPYGVNGTDLEKDIENSLLTFLYLSDSESKGNQEVIDKETIIHIHETVSEESENIKMTNINNKSLISDLTMRKRKNESTDDLQTKKVILNILSDLIG